MNTSKYPPISCIIAFQDEGLILIELLKKVITLHQVSEIICVYDDISNTTYKEVEKKFPTVKVFRQEQNKGKSAAVEYGLQKAKNDIILLLDADLINVKIKEIQTAIEAFLDHPEIDMILLDRSNDPWYAKIFRLHTVLTGDRVLRKKDLVEIFKTSPYKYQLEIAINLYMEEHNKKVFWLPCTAIDSLKIHKIGLLQGLKEEGAMFYSIFAYGGIIKTIKMFAFFGRTRFTKEST